MTVHSTHNLLASVSLCVTYTYVEGEVHPKLTRVERCMPCEGLQVSKRVPSHSACRSFSLYVHLLQIVSVYSAAHQTTLSLARYI
jgi:hypothetical protein